MIINKIAICPAREFEEVCKAFKSPDGFPPQFTEITEDQFRRTDFFKYTPSYINLETFRVEGYTYSAQLFMFNNKTGVAIINDNNLKKIRYYKFGCDHEMKRSSTNSPWEGSKGYHSFVCTKCGYTEQVDSSG